VADFNVRIRSIPDVLIARLLGMERFEFFEAEEGTRGDIHASFTTPVEGEAPDSPAERE
jgi:hypothetical protein